MFIHESLEEIKKRSSAVCDLFDIISTDSAGYNALNTVMSNSAESFKKLEKLNRLVGELEKELKNEEFDYYRTIAELYEEIQEKVVQFAPYGAIPFLRSLTARVSSIETELKKQLQWTFREIGQLISSDADNIVRTDTTVDIDSMDQIYLVIDALGIDFRRDLLERFAQLQLISYEKAFKFGTPFCGLDALDRRYTWFRLLLKEVDDRFSTIFPRRWVVPVHLFLEFSRRTQKHLSDYLTAQEAQFDHNENMKDYVNMLLLALKSLLSFEAEMKASFNQSIRGEDVDLMTVFPDLKSSIAEAFDPFLGPYVQLEREGLEDLLQSLARDEELAVQAPNSLEKVDDEHEREYFNAMPRGPFDSSRQMFEYIKNSLKRCSAFSTGITYLSLSREFRVCLHNYAESLKFRCPSPRMVKADGQAVYDLSPEQEILMCRLICTGDYCVDTLPALETKMKEHVQLEFATEIDFSAQLNAFVDMIAYTQNLLVIGWMERLNPHLRTMRKMNWANVESVGDESRYVKDIFGVWNEAIVRARGQLASSSFQSLCLKFVNVFGAALLETVWKLKRVSKTGAGQLLLDVNGLKSSLLNLPRVRLNDVQGESVVISKVYVQVVNAKINPVETILKLCCPEDDRMEEMFALLWPDATSEQKEAVLSMKLRSNLLPLDSVGGILKDGARVMTSTSMGQNISHGLSKGAKSAVGGLRGAVGDFRAVMSGKLFDDDASSSSKPSSGSSSSSNNSSGSNTNNTSNSNNNSNSNSSASSNNKSGLKTDFKNPFSSLGFKK